MRQHRLNSKKETLFSDPANSPCQPAKLAFSKAQIYVFLMLLMTISISPACKKFLQVEPIERLSGNIYWKSKGDVDAFANDLYARIWLKLQGTSFMAATGELRTGEIRPTTTGAYRSSDGSRRTVYNSFAVNDLKTALYQPSAAWSNMNFVSITRWAEFYQIVQGANIMFYYLDKGVPGVSEQDINRFKAEAVYLRCFAYFFMVRIYGDVPYYTNAFSEEPLPRENFVSVLNKCMAELKQYKDFLPWKYEDNAYLGVRASRGAALTLLMHMNMWNAGFDLENKQRYYEEAAGFGREVVESGIYSLVPVADMSRVMQGKTEEGIIEFKESVNSGATYNKLAFIAEMFVSTPIKAQAEGTWSHAFYKKTYLSRIYSDNTDRRISTWFINAFSDDGNFSMKKFEGPVSTRGFPDWSIVISRYADVILLRAEALAEIDQDEEAIKMLDMIRSRAGANLYEATEDLKDAIYKERCRELIGEGHAYFDLIRTRRIMDGSWTSNPLTPSQFAAGGWTWPIDPSALSRNPYMTINEYWQ